MAGPANRLHSTGSISHWTDGVRLLSAPRGLPCKARRGQWPMTRPATLGFYVSACAFPLLFTPAPKLTMNWLRPSVPTRSWPYLHTRPPAMPPAHATNRQFSGAMHPLHFGSASPSFPAAVRKVCAGGRKGP